MRVTIQRTLDLDEIPSQIDEDYLGVLKRLKEIESQLHHASNIASEGLYVDSSKLLEEVRLNLSSLDKTVEEIQSLSLSYEKIRIESHLQVPERHEDE